MIPRPIYELLPYIYLFIGLMAAFNVYAMFGRVAGIALAVMGVVIWKMRWKYRQS